MVQDREDTSQDDMFEDRTLKKVTFHFHDAWFDGIYYFCHDAEDIQEDADKDQSAEDQSAEDQSESEDEDDKNKDKDDCNKDVFDSNQYKSRKMRSSMCLIS